MHGRERINILESYREHIRGTGLRPVDGFDKFAFEPHLFKPTLYGPKVGLIDGAEADFNPVDTDAETKIFIVHGGQSAIDVPCRGTSIMWNQAARGNCWASMNSSRSDFRYLARRPILMHFSGYREVHFHTARVPSVTPRYSAASLRDIRGDLLDFESSVMTFSCWLMTVQILTVGFIWVSTNK